MHQLGLVLRKFSSLFVIAFLVSLVLAQSTGTFDDALTLFQDGKYEEAFNICKTVVDENPNFTGAQFLLGRIYFAMGNLDSAIAFVDNALKMDRNNPEYREIRDKIASFGSKLTEASRLSTNADFEGAKVLYEEIIKENPNFADAYFSLGMVYINLNNLAKAAKNFRKAIEMKPEEEKYNNMYQSIVKKHLFEGNQLFKRRNYQDALKKFQQVIIFNPDEFMAYYFSAAVYLAERNYPEALKQIEKSIELNLEYQKSHLIRGKIYLKMNNSVEALKSFEAAITLDPEYVDAWNNLGSLYYNKKEYKEAIPAYKKVIKLRPEYPKAYENLGAIYLELKNYKDASQYLSKAVELNPRSYSSWYRLAQTYNQQGQCQKAKEAAKSSLKIKANWAPVLIELGVAERCLGNKPAAKQAFQIAMKDPKWRKVAQFELKTLQ